MKAPRNACNAAQRKRPAAAFEKRSANRMKTKLWGCFALILAGALIANSARSQEVATPKIRVLTLLGRPLQVTVAETHGLFAKYGVAVETDNSSSSDELRAKLAAGKGDVAYA